VAYTDEKLRFTSGHLAVQQYSPQTVVEFRKIEIKEMPEPKQSGQLRPPSSLPQTQTVDLGDGVKMQFVLIPKGKFIPCRRRRSGSEKEGPAPHAHHQGGIVSYQLLGSARRARQCVAMVL
jgi:hypothetical protein